MPGAHGLCEVRDPVRLRVEDRHDVGRILGRAEQRAVGVDGRVAAVARDEVVQIVLLVEPVPGGDDDVALDALRPLRLRLRQLALGDAVRPLAVILERHAAELAGQEVDHLLAGLAGLHAPHPRLGGGFERPEALRDRAGRELAELMAADAAVVLHGVEPALLGDLGRDVALAAELADRRDRQHRIPVDRRVVMRRRGRARRRRRREGEDAAGLGLHLLGIDEAVAAHPDAVGGLRQVGHDEAALGRP